MKKRVSRSASVSLALMYIGILQSRYGAHPYRHLCWSESESLWKAKI